MNSNTFLALDYYRYVISVVQKLRLRGPIDIDWAGSAGSDRSFYRVFIGARKTLILMLWNKDDPDWDHFLSLHETPGVATFTPALIDYDRSLGAAVLAEGGGRRLKDVLFSPVSEESRTALLKNALDMLSSWHAWGAENRPIPGTRLFDAAYYKWEADYFKEHVCRLLPDNSVDFSCDWEEERERLTEYLLSYPAVLLHRDFQSENILLHNEKMTFVDIQGARWGAGLYDAASLIYDPYTAEAVNPQTRLILENYAGQLWGEGIHRFGVQRLMQALGAYGKLTVQKKKKRYRRYVLPALQTLSGLLGALGTYPAMEEVVTRILSDFKKNNKEFDTGQGESIY
ncbi:MAG: aminoglycoside phosphotransferase family protein [Fibrobacterota bacterium]